MASPSIAAPHIEVTKVSSSSPVLPTRTVTETIGGVSTTVITQGFADRIMITITQLNKFGCIYQATTSSSPADPFNRPPATESALPPPLPTTSVTKLVGTEPTPAHAALYHLYISQLASIVNHTAPTDPRPLIVTLALKATPSHNAPPHEEDDDDLMASEAERTRFIAVMQLVRTCAVW